MLSETIMSKNTFRLWDKERVEPMSTAVIDNSELTAPETALKWSSSAFFASEAVMATPKPGRAQTPEACLLEAIRTLNTLASRLDIQKPDFLERQKALKRVIATAEAWLGGMQQSVLPAIMASLQTQVFEAAQDINAALAASLRKVADLYEQSKAALATATASPDRSSLLTAEPSTVEVYFTVPIPTAAVKGAGGVEAYLRRGHSLDNRPCFFAPEKAAAQTAEGRFPLGVVAVEVNPRSIKGQDAVSGRVELVPPPAPGTPFVAYYEPGFGSGRIAEARRELKPTHSTSKARMERAKEDLLGHFKHGLGFSKLPRLG